MQKTRRSVKKKTARLKSRRFLKYGFRVFFAGLHSQWYKSGLFLTVFNGFYSRLLFWETASKLLLITERLR